MVIASSGAAVAAAGHSHALTLSRHRDGQIWSVAVVRWICSSPPRPRGDWPPLCRREGAPPRASSGAVSLASLVAGSLPLAAARRLEPRGPFVLPLGAESAVLSLAGIVG